MRFEELIQYSKKDAGDPPASFLFFLRKTNYATYLLSCLHMIYLN